MVTEAEAKRILEETKVIGANLSWKSEGETFRLEATVLCPESEEILRPGALGGRTAASYCCIRTCQFANTPFTPFTETL